MDFNLSEEEKMIQRQAAEFGEKEGKPRAKEIDETGEPPLDLVKKMAEFGYYGLCYPPEYGGVGAGYLAYILVVEQIWKACVGAGLSFPTQTLCQEPVWRFGTEEQKRKYLPPLCSGEALGCLVFTESATGSDPKALTCKAKPTEGGYIIEGSKMFCTGATVAKYVILFAMDEEIRRVNSFIVDISSEGFNIVREIPTLGGHGWPTCELYLDNIYVPDECLIGPRGQGYAVLLETIASSKMTFGAGATGMAQAALEMSISYAKERLAYGRPMTELPSIQWLLAEMSSRVEAGRLLAYKTAFCRDQGMTGEPMLMESARSKLFNAQMVVEVVDMAMQVHGAYGYTKDLELERIYRDAKIIGIIEATNELQRVITARGLTR